MTETEKKMAEMTKGLKPQPGKMDIPQRLVQPPWGSHPELNSDGTVKK